MMDGWGRFPLVGSADSGQQNVRPVSCEINYMTLPKSLGTFVPNIKLKLLRHSNTK